MAPLYCRRESQRVTNTVPAADFPTAGAPLTYVPWNELARRSLPAGICNAGVAPPCVPKTNDPAKLAHLRAHGLTPGDAFPGNVIPAELIDQNAVRFMGTGAIPKPNIGTSQFSHRQSSRRSCVKTWSASITTSRTVLHLMGHWIHDSMSQTIYPTMWSGDSYTTVGDVFQNPSWASVIKLTQTLSPTLLNETALNVNGNTININPAGI